MRLCHNQAEAALALWDGQGSFVFTGSAGVYAREDGSRVSEDGEVFPAGKDERTDRRAHEQWLCYCSCAMRLCREARRSNKVA